MSTTDHPPVRFTTGTAVPASVRDRQFTELFDMTIYEVSNRQRAKSPANIDEAALSVECILEMYYVAGQLVGQGVEVDAPDLATAFAAHYDNMQKKPSS
jgi:hypothetical protein